MWSFESVGSGYVQLKSNFNGQVADVAASSTAAGAPVKAWAPTGGFNQHWALVPTNTRYLELRNRNSGLLLDNANGSLADGAPVQQWTANGQAPERWQIERVN